MRKEFIVAYLKVLFRQPPETTENHQPLSRRNLEPDTFKIQFWDVSAGATCLVYGVRIVCVGREKGILSEKQ
jgi:hypothetical protein